MLSGSKTIQIVSEDLRTISCDATRDIFVACIPAFIAMVASVIVVILTQMWNKRNEVRLKFYERRLDALERINENALRFFEGMFEMYHKKKQGKKYVAYVHRAYVELSQAIESASIYLTKDEKGLMEDCQIRIALVQYTNWEKKISEKDYKAMLLIKHFFDDTLREIALDKQPHWMRQ